MTNFKQKYIFYSHQKS